MKLIDELQEIITEPCSLDSWQAEIVSQAIHKIQTLEGEAAIERDQIRLTPKQSMNLRAVLFAILTPSTAFHVAHTGPWVAEVLAQLPHYAGVLPDKDEDVLTEQALFFLQAAAPGQLRTRSAHSAR